MDVIKIKTLIEYRDVAYNRLTREIFDKLEPELSKGVQMFLQKQREIRWISLVSADIPNHAIISGIAIPVIGDVLDISGEQIVISEDNISQYNQTLSLVIPFRLLERVDRNKIYRYLSILKELGSKQGGIDIVEYMQRHKLEDLSNNVNLSDNSVILDVLTAPTHIDGFEVTDLPKHKRDQLDSFLALNKGIKHEC